MFNLNSFKILVCVLICYVFMLFLMKIKQFKIVTIKNNVIGCFRFSRINILHICVQFQVLN